MITLSKNKRLVILLSTALTMLAIPFVAMQFSNEVSWSLFDFAVAGILLTGTVLAIEFVLRRVQQTKHRIFLASVIVLLLLLVWIELAVGVFGTPIAGN